MKTKLYPACIMLLFFNGCFAMTGEIGPKVIDEMRLVLKEPCLDLLSSSDLVDWYTFEKRLEVLKKSISEFEGKISKLKTPENKGQPAITSADQSAKKFEEPKQISAPTAEELIPVPGLIVPAKTETDLKPAEQLAQKAPIKSIPESKPTQPTPTEKTVVESSSVKPPAETPQQNATTSTSQPAVVIQSPTTAAVPTTINAAEKAPLTVSTPAQQNLPEKATTSVPMTVNPVITQTQP